MTQSCLYQKVLWPLQGKKAKLTCGIVTAPITSLFNTHRPEGWAVCFAPEVQIWLQRDMGSVLSLTYFSRGEESQPLPITHVPLTATPSYRHEIVPAGMCLNHHSFIRLMHPSPGSQEVSVCPLGFIALNLPPKGLLCAFFQELRRDLTFFFRMSLCQVDLHFVSAQLLESSSWWSNPLHSPRTVFFSGKREMKASHLMNCWKKKKVYETRENTDDPDCDWWDK